jgi:hypothetical protein
MMFVTYLLICLCYFGVAATTLTSQSDDKDTHILEQKHHLRQQDDQDWKWLAVEDDRYWSRVLQEMSLTVVPTTTPTSPIEVTTTIPTARPTTPPGSATAEPTSTPSSLTTSNSTDDDFVEVASWEYINRVRSGVPKVDLSSDGTRMVTTSEDSTSIVVYELDTDEWIQIGNEISLPPIESDQSGVNILSIAISGDGNRIAFATASEDGIGKVQIYEITNSEDWSQVGASLDGQDVNDEFGYSLSLSFDGYIVAASAPLAPLRQGPGYVKVFENDVGSSTWQQIGDTLIGEEGRGSGFGYSLELSSMGDTLVIGMPFRNDGDRVWLGRVQVFQFTDSHWKQWGQTIDGDINFDQFGRKVTLSKNDGSTIAASAISSIGDKRGLVRVYRYQHEDDTWTMLGNYIEGMSPENMFGVQMDMNEIGNIIAIGDTQEQSTSSSSSSSSPSVGGYIVVLQWDGEEWVVMGHLLRGDNQFGTDVAISYDGLSVAGSERGDSTGVSHATFYQAILET